MGWGPVGKQAPVKEDGYTHHILPAALTGGVGVSVSTEDGSLIPAPPAAGDLGEATSLLCPRHRARGGAARLRDGNHHAGGTASAR